MFSGINEAWNNDPVKDITKKMSNGSFSKPPDIVRALNVKNQTNDVNNNRINKKNRKNRENIEAYTSISLSDDDEITDASISLYSTCKSDAYTPLASTRDLSPMDIRYSNNKSTKRDSGCNFNHRHLSKCTECRGQLKRMISSNIEKKMKDILLELKLKELHIYGNKNNSDDTKQTHFFNDNWKEVAILVMGSIIALLIVYLIVKSMNK